MKILTKGLFIVIFALFAFVSHAQVSKLQVNEIMVNNVTNYQNHYGYRTPWFEIYNNSGASTDMGGCWLSDDPNNLKKYLITKGDKNTLMGPRQFLVFWADNNPTHGTFHVNFTFKPGEEATVYLTDAGGKLIDKLTVPASATALQDISYGRMVDGGKELGVLEKPTPDINNVFVNQDAANERFRKNDPTGFGMSITAVLVVFIALILLYIIFKYTGKFHVNHAHKKAVKSAEAKGDTEKIIVDSGEISGEVCAAIAAAIHAMQNDAHDIEDTILTIEKKAVNYSPWSSKIYGLRQIPEVKSNR